MKTLYWKLAWHGIYKNQKIYLPFLLTSIGITMNRYVHPSLESKRENMRKLTGMFAVR